MMKNDGAQHDACKKETLLPRHAVAKNTRCELQKTRIDHETYSNEHEP
jgi:hypothetical protein